MDESKNAVTWFEIPATDINRAKDFYEEVFGLNLSLMEMGPVKMAWFPRNDGAAGSSGGLIEAEGRVPSKAGSLVYFSVSDIDDTLAKVTAAGGEIVLPKASGDYGAVAHFQDSEGNLIALHSHK